MKKPSDPVYLEVACCTSGLCVGCHARGNHGDPKRREWRRWTEEPITRERAERVAANWRNYSPRIVEVEVLAPAVAEARARGEMHADDPEWTA